MKRIGLRRLVSRTLKGALTLNLAFFMRAARVGLRDALEGLAAAYDRMQPFGPARRWRLMYEFSTIPPLAQKYCRGRGIEIGPGPEPYCDPRTTMLLDRFPNYRDGGKARIDVVAEAFELPTPDHSADYLFSAHCLEHVPDTLKALREWKRVVKPGGILFLILPHGRRTFDRGRALSTLDHHIADSQNNVAFDDAAHWKEFEQVALSQGEHFWLRDPRCRKPDGTFDVRWISERGYIHYHVWTQNEFIDLVKYIGCDVLVVLEEVPDRPDSFLVIARIRDERGGG